MRLLQYILILVIWLITSNLYGQEVYKTPSGERYHLSSCRMVENVSKKLVDKKEIENYDLTPCKICKPPNKSQLTNNFSLANKAVGESNSVRCIGYTQSNTRCKHMTKLANGYCYQHTSQNSKSKIYNNKEINSSTSTCGARTQSGGNCKRKVKGGGKCYQHK